MKKIYFAASIRCGRDDADLYNQIIELISSLGHPVLTEHVGLKTIKSMGEEGRAENWIYERDMNWLEESDAIIAEVTNPSLGVGYEIAKSRRIKQAGASPLSPRPRQKAIGYDWR